MKRSSKLFPSLILALGVAGTVAARAEDAVTWQLLPEVKVDSSGIFLSQLVVPTTSSSVVHPSTVVLPHIRLAPAPGLGQTASLSRVQIIELVQKQDASIETSNWTGAARIRISRRTVALTDSAMLNLLTPVLQRDEIKDRGELELHLAHSLQPSLIPEEGVTVKITELPSTGVSPSFYLRCELWNNDEHVSDWQIGLQAHIWREIPVATDRLMRGQLLKDAAVTLQRRDVLVFPDACTNFPTDDENLEIAETVSAGLPLMNRSVRERPAVLRGNMVDAIYQDGSLSISLKVESLEDGLPGQTIRVRNPKSRRELYGKVQNDQTILISL